jgi:hypothetical protein
MQSHALDGHGARPVSIDVCLPCQAIWFDALESPALSPAGTLALFHLIGTHTDRPQPTAATLAKCPRCQSRLLLTKDMQRTTRFEYLRCPHGHGRLTSFLDFLKEKDFIRPLTRAQVEELRQNVSSVNCAGCGAPVDLAAGSACTHCGAPLCMLDLAHAGRLIAQLQGAAAERPIDPALPLNLARARRETERAFASLAGADDDAGNYGDSNLVLAGVQAIARWLTTPPTTNH